MHDPLRAAGLRRTPARTSVLEAVRALGRPVSHADLASGLDLDEITLYRTLSALTRVGLVHRVLGVDGVWRYGAHAEKPGCPGNHAHWLCTGCGAMSCLPEQAIPRLEVPEGAMVEGRSLLAWGRCAACAVNAP